MLKRCDKVFKIDFANTGDTLPLICGTIHYNSSTDPDKKQSSKLTVYKTFQIQVSLNEFTKLLVPHPIDTFIRLSDETGFLSIKCISKSIVHSQASKGAFGMEILIDHINKEFVFGCHRLSIITRALNTDRNLKYLNVVWSFKYQIQKYRGVKYYSTSVP